jgi:hypothetical protein
MFVMGRTLAFVVPVFSLTYRLTDSGGTSTSDNILFPPSGYVARFVKAGDTVEGYYNDQLIGSYTQSNWDLEYVALTDSNGEGSANVFDWVRVREYAVNEPIVTSDENDSPNMSCGTCYDKAVTVDNTAGGDEPGYQIRVEISAGDATFWQNVTANGDDIRFFDSDGTTPLPFWIESFEPPPAIFSFVRISAFSQGHTCAVLVGGEAACWGRNGNYQLGDGTTDPRTAPVVVIHDDASVTHGNTDLQSDVIAISTGDYQSLAVHANGTLSAWGANSSAQGGTGSNLPANIDAPAPVCIQVQN